ncbi:unnamed protein product [Menidia menidia]|uniref:(Atlantic silverside) hypothetical protein n=1 Tax=Menidia menidia TaxID=238744 RepID=A0A8S4BRA1_9TELE|nr:unnamed protein product [Menidia menidia]
MRRAVRTEDAGREEEEEEEEGYHHHRRARHGLQSPRAGMESTRAHRTAGLDPESRGGKSTGKPDMRAERRGGNLHLQRTMIFLMALTIQPQTVCAVGMFELQIRHFQNPDGLLQSGDCCDAQTSGGQRCSARDQCDTFFQACLKEYQARVAPTGACTFGSGSTDILGGNSQLLHHRGHDRGRGEDRANIHIAIPFKYAWPVSRCECEKVLHEKTNRDRFQGQAMGAGRAAEGAELGHTVAAAVRRHLKGRLYLDIYGRGEGWGRLIPCPRTWDVQRLGNCEVTQVSPVSVGAGLIQP